MNDQYPSYTITITHKDAVHREVFWHNTISSGKSVTALVATVHSNAIFNIYAVSNNQRNKYTYDNHIVLSDHPHDLLELGDTRGRYMEIENKEEYTNEEIAEITTMLMKCLRMINNNNNNKDKDKDKDTDIYSSIDDDVMEEHNWVLDDIMYGIHGECIAWESIPA